MSSARCDAKLCTPQQVWNWEIKVISNFNKWSEECFFFFYISLTSVKNKCSAVARYSRFSRTYCRLSPHLKFNHLPWKRIIYEQICSLEWLVLCVHMAFRWDGPSESLIAAAAAVPKRLKQTKKGWQVCFSKYACNYSNSVHIRIIPPQNTCRRLLWALLVHLLCCLSWTAFSCPPMVEWRWPRVNNEQPGTGGEERCIRPASIPGGSPALISTGSRVYAQSSGQSH